MTYEPFNHPKRPTFANRWITDPGPDGSLPEWERFEIVNRAREHDGLPLLPSNSDLTKALLACGFTDCEGVLYLHRLLSVPAEAAEETEVLSGTRAV